MSGLTASPTATVSTAVAVAGASRERSRPVLLGLILLAATLLRWFYLDSGYNDKRFWDERFSIESILPFVETGKLTLVHDYYPSPVWSLPPGYLLRFSAALAEATGITSLRVAEGSYVTQTGFRLLRGLQMVYGVIGVAVLFAIGRQLFDDQVGLLAALILAFVPWHIHASSYLKPDALQATCVLLAFLFCLRTLDQQRPRDAVLAGVAIALAISAKFTGGLIALTLVLGTILTGWRDRRRVLLLALAGAVSAGAFVVLNPDWLGYPEILARHGADYALRAKAAEMTRAQIPGRLLELLLGWNGHRRAVGCIALLTMACWLLSLARTSVKPRDRVHRAMCLFYPLIHTVFYIRQTAYFKENNFLTVFPFTALAAAWGIVTVWRQITAVWPGLQHRAWRSLAVAAVLWLTTNPGFRYIYNSYLPTTYDAVIAYLHQTWQPIAPRLVLADWSEDSPSYESRRDFAGGESVILAVDGLERQSRRRLESADGLLFPKPSAFGGGPQAQFYRDLLAITAPSQIHVMKPKLLRMRGPTAVLIDRSWREAQPSSELVVRRCTTEPCYEATIPSWVRAGEYATMHVWVAFAVLNQLDAVPIVQIGSQRPELVWTHRLGSGALFISDRFVIESDSPRIRFIVGPVDTTPETINVTLYRWRDAEGGTAFPSSDRSQQPRLYWQNRSHGQVAAWRLNGTEVSDVISFPAETDPNLKLVGIGDIGCHGQDTLVWQHQQTGEVKLLRYDQLSSPVSSVTVNPVVDDRLFWVEAVADLTGDACAQLIAHTNERDKLVMLHLAGATPIVRDQIDEPMPPGFFVAAVGDFDGDGFKELYWQQQDGGQVIAWVMDGTTVRETTSLTAFKQTTGWHLAGAITLDGIKTMVVRNLTSHRAAFWLMDGEQVRQEQFLAPMTGPDWELIAVR